MTPWNDQNKQHSKKYSYIIMYHIIFIYHFRHKMLASGDISLGVWRYFDKNL